MNEITFKQLKKTINESWQDYINDSESLQDILKEMRELAKKHTHSDGEVDDALAEIPIDDYADRIEASIERDHQKIMRALKLDRLDRPSY
jgi:hypothetical protein